jgi:hypothetical protein
MKTDLKRVDERERERERETGDDWFFIKSTTKKKTV